MEFSRIPLSFMGTHFIWEFRAPVLLSHLGVCFKSAWVSFDIIAPNAFYTLGTRGEICLIKDTYLQGGTAIWLWHAGSTS